MWSLTSTYFLCLCDLVRTDTKIESYYLLNIVWAIDTSVCQCSCIWRDVKHLDLLHICPWTPSLLLQGVCYHSWVLVNVIHLPACKHSRKDIHVGCKLGFVVFIWYSYLVWTSTCYDVLNAFEFMSFCTTGESIFIK